MFGFRSQLSLAHPTQILSYPAVVFAHWLLFSYRPSVSITREHKNRWAFAIHPKQVNICALSLHALLGQDHRSMLDVWMSFEDPVSQSLYSQIFQKMNIFLCSHLSPKKIPRAFQETPWRRRTNFSLVCLFFTWLEKLCYGSGVESKARM